MMMNDPILNYIIFFLLLEIYEMQWQKAQTVMGMLARMFEIYKKSVLLFLVMHPTFYFAIYFMLITDYNMYALSLFAIKTLDIATKILLIKQVFIAKEISHELSLALLTPTKTIPYLGVIAYAPLIYLAFT